MPLAGSIIVRVPGPRLRLEENDGIRQALLDHLAKGNNRIILNFSDVEFVDSSFLGLLIIILKRATTAGGDLRLCCLRPALVSIFELMRLNRLFMIYDTEQAATGSFQ